MDNDQPGTSGAHHQLEQYEEEDRIEDINQSLLPFQESPLDRKRMKQVNYQEKAEKVKKVVVQSLQACTPVEISSSEEIEIKRRKEDQEKRRKSADDLQVIEQLKEHYEQCTSRNEKLQVLTALPKSWTIQQIETEFGVTNYTEL